MKINPTDTSPLGRQWPKGVEVSGGTFEAALTRARETPYGGLTEAPAREAKPLPDTRDKYISDAQAEFFAYMKKSPEERLREAVMKELGLTEDDLNAMDPETRKVAEEAIAEKIKERLLAQQESDKEKVSRTYPL
ncbi:hypothetical protein [Uliginosibacterium sp. H1]|uniref:hypothetical protein n=1 Tax=Uliginosibacterium sp. H1 TaxID=3114757 RepID=UPI002E19263A|nr:hypothetical protein [Uliginosibacterium sp. H1]